MCTFINKKAERPAEITQGSTKSIEIYCNFTESPDSTDENGVMKGTNAYVYIYIRVSLYNGCSTYTCIQLYTTEMYA